VLGYTCRRIIDWHKRYLVNHSYDILLADNEKERVAIYKEHIKLIDKKIDLEQTNSI
jgi:hypothetical protein